jgi:hypothetical protein
VGELFLYIRFIVLSPLDMGSSQGNSIDTRLNYLYNKLLLLLLASVVMRFFFIIFLVCDIVGELFLYIRFIVPSPLDIGS